MTMAEASPRQPDARTGLGVRVVVALVFMTWAAHSASLIGLLAGNATSKVALHFHTTQIAWFSLAPSLLSLFLAPAVYWAATVYGKRKVMLAVAATAMGGDVIAALSTNYSMLLAGRAISGIYAGAAVLTYALVRDLTPKKSVGSASGAVAGGIAVIGVVGPFLSAWLLDSWGFRGTLWGIVGLAAVTVIGLAVFIPESPVRDQTKRFDWLGTLLLGAGVTAAVYGLGQGSSWGWTNSGTLAYIVGGLAAMVVFVLVEARVAHPLFPIAMLNRRPVWSMLVATSIVGLATSVGTVGYLLALYPKIPHLSAGLGWSATHYALIGLPSAPIILIVAVYAGRLTRRFDPRVILAIGSTFFAVGMVLNVYYHYTAAQLISTGLFGALGLGLVITTLPILVISAVSPREQALGNGAQSIFSGVVSAAVAQLTFVVMAHRGMVFQHTQFYSDASFKDAYWMYAGIGALGALACFIMPRMKRMSEVEAGLGLAPVDGEPAAQAVPQG